MHPRNQKIRTKRGRIMILERVLAELEKLVNGAVNGAVDRSQILKRVNRDLAHELPRHRLEVLRAFRVGAVHIMEKLSGEERGYLRAILDTVAAYEVAIEHLRRPTEVAEIAIARGWTPVLKCLAGDSKRGSEIAAQLNLEPDLVLLRLKEMFSVNVVFASAPPSDTDKEDRVYCLSMLGEAAAKLLTDN